MKCEGGENPPCVRCRRARRECRPQIPHQPGTNLGFVLAPTTDNNAVLSEQSRYNFSASAPSMDAHLTTSSNGSQHRPFQADAGVRRSTVCAPAPSRSVTELPKHSCLVPSSTLPSIYSSPPIVVVSGSHASPDHDDDNESPDSFSSCSLPPLLDSSSRDFLIPLSDLREMIEI
jgi:hypothetical protein